MTREEVSKKCDEFNNNSHISDEASDCCADCKYSAMVSHTYGHGENAVHTTKLICRRYPPAIAKSFFKEEEDSTEYITYSNRFPEVESLVDDGIGICGEFVKRR